MADKLFSEFPTPSVNEWIDALTKELKGKDYKETLKWITEDGIELMPFYTSAPESSNTVPGEFPYRRGFNPDANSWEIDQEIRVWDNFVTANRVALDALGRGASSITFNGKIDLRDDLSILLNEIEIQYIQINFRNTGDPLLFLELLKEYCEIKSLDFKKLKGSISDDYFSSLLINGNWNVSEEEDKNTLSQLALNTSDASFFKTITVDASIYHNCGATPCQELAFALAAGNEYLSLLTEKGLNIEAAAAKIQFRFSSGVDFYQEISKLRAFRVLWSNIIEGYKPEFGCTHKAWIHSETSQLYLSPRDKYTNLLRETTAVFASVCGGCDSMSVLPFDGNDIADNHFSSRMGRNIQLILREESGLDKVIDPAGGSYFMEQLTDGMIERSWEMFLEIEKKNGFISCMKEGYIQDEISASAEKKKAQFREGKIKMIGLNTYINPESKEEIIYKDEVVSNEFKTVQLLHFGNEIPVNK